LEDEGISLIDFLGFFFRLAISFRIRFCFLLHLLDFGIGKTA